MPTRSKAAPIAAKDSPQETISNQVWFTVDEAAAHLRLSPSYIRHLIHDRQLKAARVGNEFRLEKCDLDQLLTRRKKFMAPYRKNTRPAVAKRWAEYREQKSRKLAER